MEFYDKHKIKLISALESAPLFYINDLLSLRRFIRINTPKISTKIIFILQTENDQAKCSEYYPHFFRLPFYRPGKVQWLPSSLLQTAFLQTWQSAVTTILTSSDCLLQPRQGRRWRKWSARLLQTYLWFEAAGGLSDSVFKNGVRLARRSAFKSPAETMTN